MPLSSIPFLFILHSQYPSLSSLPSINFHLRVASFLSTITVTLPLTLTFLASPSQPSHRLFPSLSLSSSSPLNILSFPRSFPPPSRHLPLFIHGSFPDSRGTFFRLSRRHCPDLYGACSTPTASPSYLFPQPHSRPDASLPFPVISSCRFFFIFFPPLLQFETLELLKFIFFFYFRARTDPLPSLPSLPVPIRSPTPPSFLSSSSCASSSSVDLGKCRPTLRLCY